VAGCCLYGDEPSGSGTTFLVTYFSAVSDSNENKNSLARGIILSFLYSSP
jgi:hypothetical protein